MMDWLSYNNKSVLMNYTDIGQSYASAFELLQKHEQFHKNCFVSKQAYTSFFSSICLSNIFFKSVNIFTNAIYLSMFVRQIYKLNFEIKGFE